MKIKYVDNDTDKCGKGCDDQWTSTPPLPDPDDEWELVFELGKKNYDGVQTFNFSVNDSALVGITESDWGLMAVASKHLCEGGISCLATRMIVITKIKPMPRGIWLLRFLCLAPRC